MKKNSFHKDDRGASLLAVLILMVVVSAIAVVITKITIVNIQMKEVERGTKKNFYSADAIMDDLRTGAREQAETALENAYADVLQHYVDYTSGGKNVQDVFKQNYMNGLEKYFADPDPMKTKVDTTNEQGNVVYRVAGYDADKVKGCILDGTQQGCFVAPADPKYEIDYGAGTFTLKDVRVVYKDAQDYETTITTDLVFSTPDMNFSGQSQVKEFMKYALIADNQINVNASGVKVDGSVYAGAGGILASNNGTGELNGRMILTRGDIVADMGSKLTVGNGNSSIWAENLMTTGKSAATLDVNGNMYVADDLALNAKESKVTLQGNYYGYNFQKNYGAGDTVATDADFSSAIMINGKSSSLNIQNLKYLLLAGRTYISRGNNSSNTDIHNTDIQMGESIAARTNQLAYYVPERYVVKVESGESTLLKLKWNDAKNVKIGEKEYPIGESDYAASIHVNPEKLDGWLDNANPIVPYYYTNGVNYYLNFKSQQDANEFYAAYYAGNTGKAGGLAGTYLDKDALIIDENNKMIMTLSGDIMYRTKPEEMFQEKAVTIEPDNWKDSAGLLWDYCSKLAVSYKSLELGLKDFGQSVTPDQVRFSVTDEKGHEKIDKSIDPLFDKLIDRSALQEEIAKHKNPGDTGDVVYKPAADVYLIDNPDNPDNPDKPNGYILPTSITKGIVVATGSVKVSGNFEGLIISGGKVTFGASVQVKGNKLLVSNLFKEDQSRKAPLFSKFFRDCSGTAASNISGQLDLDSYINYDEWKKN